MESSSLAKLVEKVTGANGRLKPADIAAVVAQEVEKAMVFYDGKESDPNQRTYPRITGGVRPSAVTLYFLTGLTNNVGNPDGALSEYNGMSFYDLPGIELEETDYASYGYWLAIPHDSDAITEVHVLGVPKSPRAVPATSLAAKASLDNTATYTGNALGMSVLTAADGSKRKAIKSGQFTADVKLTATFDGTSSTVEGKISNFRGNAVGTDWKVDLKTAPLNAAEPRSLDNYGLARGDGVTDEGMWHARANVSTADDIGDKRPIGLSGVFRVFFKDGRAAGGYATVKDD